VSALRQVQLVSAGLENIFCYREARVDFSRGVSVFSGANGSGKSSLLEALFFALFGSATGTITGRSLAQVLREGEKKGSIELTFALGSARYTVRLVLHRSGQRVLAEGKHCCLSRDDGQTWSGVKQVTAQIEALLQLDSDDFANCLYVRQGEVDRLINASSQQRQSTIDRLLRLTRIDDYQNRAKKVHTALARRRTLLQGGLDTLKGALEALDAQQLAAHSSALERELAALDAQQRVLAQEASTQERAVLTLEAEQAQFERTVEQLKTIKASYEEQDAELLQRKDEEQALHRNARQQEEHLAKLKSAWQARQREALWASLELTPEVALEPLLQRALQRVAERERTLGEKREQLAAFRGERRASTATVERLERELDGKRAQQQSERAALSQLEQALGTALSALELEASIASFEPQKQRDGQQREAQKRREALERLNHERAHVKAQHQAATAQRQQVAALLQADRCPTCHQPLSEAVLSTHEVQLETQTAALAERLKTLNAEVKVAQGWLRQSEAGLAALAQLEPMYAQWQERGRRLERLGAEVDTLLSRQQALLVEQEQHGREEEALVGQGTRLKEAQEEAYRTLQFLQAAQENKTALERQRDTVTRERERLREFLRYSDKLRLGMQQLERRHSEIKQQLNVLDHAAFERTLAQHHGELERVKSQLKALQTQRDGVQQQLGQVETQLRRAEELKDELEKASLRQQTLERVEAEMDRVQALYGEVKAAQRQQNMDALNGLFNHFFRLMEPGMAYDRAQLSPECDIQVVRTDGRQMSPSIMSGGERALINLALRAALHQLISEAGGVMLPLFFDEPTVFLDEHHVQKLEFLFADLGSRVGQVIVVSHEASLVESADHEYRVHKDADNVGHVERVR